MAPKDEEGIKVFVRVRPLNDREKQLNRTCIGVNDKKTAALVTNRADGKTQTFAYDKVEDQDCTQEHVFEAVGLPMCENVLQGFNGTVFAYGQTGAGKTFTMQGSDGDSNSNDATRGLIPRTLEQLFKRIGEMKAEGTEVTCKASFLEIYNENVTDLLSDKATSITIRDDPRKGVVIEGASEQVVTCAEDTYKALTIGSHNRKTGATCMNKESSRSHSVFSLQLMIKSIKDGVTHRKFSRFNLIDLAGSERQKHTNSSGDRLKEANNINRSLSALGNVIMSLANKNDHVPYRDSKLTFMLKDSIGGNSKTWIIANISPAEMCVEETLSTLKFVRFAKLVKNVATVNQDSSGDMKALKAELERVKALLAAAEERASGMVVAVPGGEGVELMCGEQSTSSEAVLLRISLGREHEARAELAREVAEYEDKISALRQLTSAQDSFILAGKLALRLKESYIQRLENKQEIIANETEAQLRLELDQVRKQLHTNPDLVRMHIRLADMTAEIEKLEEQLDETEVNRLESANKKQQEDIESLSEGLRLALDGKNACEAQVMGLMEELEDKQETIEHLQVCVGEMEFNMNLKDNANQTLSDENNDLRVLNADLGEQLTCSNEERLKVKSELVDLKETCAKLQQDVLQTMQERDSAKASFEAFEKDAEEVVSGYQIQLADSSAKNEGLSKQLADSSAKNEELTKQMEELTGVKNGLAKDKEALEAMVADMQKKIEQQQQTEEALRKELSEAKECNDVLSAKATSLAGSLADANECTANLKNELNEVQKMHQETLCAHEAAIEAAKGQMEDLNKAMAKLIVEHEATVVQMHEAQEATLGRLADEAEAERRKLAQDHEAVVNRLTEAYEGKISEAQKLHEDALAKSEKMHQSVVEKMAAEQENVIKELEASHAAVVAAHERSYSDLEREKAEALMSAKREKDDALADALKDKEEALSAAQKVKEDELAKAQNEREEALEDAKKDKQEALANAQKEREQLAATHEAETEQLVKEHKSAIKEVEKQHARDMAELKKEHKTDQRKMEQDHKQELDNLKQQHDAYVMGLREEFDKEKDKIAVKHADEIKALKGLHDDAMYALQEEHASFVKQMTETHNAELNKVEESRSAALKEMKKLAHDLDALVVEKAAALKEFELSKKGMQRILDDTNAHVDSLRKREEDLTNANAKLDKQATELESSVASLESQNLELSHSVKELSSEVSVLKRDVAKLEKKNENAERANEKLAEAKEDLKKEIKAVQEELKQSAQDLEEANQAIQGLEKKVSEQAEAKEELKKENKMLHKDNKQNAKDLQVATEAMHSMEKKVSEQEQHISEQQEMMMQSEEARMDASSRLEVLQGEAKQMTKELKAAQAKDKELQTSIAQLKAKVALLEHEAEKVSESKKELDEKFDESVALNKDLSKQIDKVKKELVAREKDCNESRHKVDMQTQQISVLKAELQSVTESGKARCEGLERELKSAIAAAASIEREKAVVTEDAKEARLLLEKARSMETELRAHIRNEQSLASVTGRKLDQTGVVSSGRASLLGTSLESSSKHPDGGRGRRALSILPDNPNAEPLSPTKERTPMKARLRGNTERQSLLADTD